MCRRCGCLKNFEAGNIRSAVVEGMLEAALLVFCAEGPHYGYELVRLLRQSGVIAGQLHSGRIYETLAGLERGGSLEVRAGESDGGPERKLFSITDEGRVRLHRWEHSLEGSLVALGLLVNRIREQVGGEIMSCNCKCNCGSESGKGTPDESKVAVNRSIEERLETIESLLERIAPK